MQQYTNQGITKNYPQYTTNFWGNNAANNYGFGTSNIEGNIANLPQITPLPTIDYSQPSSLLFDGKSLNWLQNGQTIKSWSAMSGNENYQSAKYMNLADNGPIPAGNWILKKGSGQSYNPNNKTWLDTLKIRNWNNYPASWGTSRIPIQPLEGTNTFGRHSMYIHGGNDFGSKGCIDLAGGNDDFYKNFINYNGDMNLLVKYPSNW